MRSKSHKKDCKSQEEASTEKKLAELIEQTQKLVNDWDTLKNQGVDVETLQKTLGFSRATYYRKRKLLQNLLMGIMPPSKRPKNIRRACWTEAQEALVLKLRQENPTYGKQKIWIILHRDHEETLSESSVGRILKGLKERGLIGISPSASRVIKHRKFTGHAQPWTFKKYEEMALGERVQIDHMSAEKNGLQIKQFTAWERKSRHLTEQIFEAAESSDAKVFLLELVANAPYPILSFQVDGGSEFRGEFEKACDELKIPLIVLPPASPKYNGGVERSNRTMREEFYGRDDIHATTLEEMREELQKAVKKYNEYRPHRWLKGMTPMEYLNSTYKGKLPSHMS
jgi:hypothetical protein